MISTLVQPTPHKIGQRIRLQMERHDMTVPKAAAACALPQPSLEEYLYGKSMPGAEALAALAKGLRCSSDYLLFGVPKP